MRALRIVLDEVLIKRRLHFLERLEQGLAALDPEVLVQQRAMQHTDDADGLGTFDQRPLMLDAFELQDQFLAMMILAAVVRQHRVDRSTLRLEGG